MKNGVSDFSQCRPVRDDDYGPSAQRLLEILGNDPLRFRIERGCRFVQNQHTRVAQESAIRNAAAINKLLKGKHNAGGRSFTLGSGSGVRSTTFQDELVNPNSQISFHPITQDAAQEQIWIICGIGQFTVYHTADVGPINDRTYQYSVHG